MYSFYVNTSLRVFESQLAEVALRLYPYAYTGEYSYSTIVSDVLCTCAVSQLAASIAGTDSAPVYHYVATAWPTSPINAFLLPFAGRYAMHGIDVFAIFRRWAAFFTQPPREKDKQFADNLVNMFKQFVRTGQPLHTAWSPLPNITAFINDTVTLSSRPYHDEQCTFWQKHGFLQYSWTN